MRSERLQIALSPEELELLERVAKHEGADDLAAWARQRLVTGAREIDPQGRPLRRQSVINWHVPVRRVPLPPAEEEDMEIPVRHIAALTRHKP